MSGIGLFSRKGAALPIPRGLEPRERKKVKRIKWEETGVTRGNPIYTFLDQVVSSLLFPY
jgi:hypothetical protein